MVKSWSPDFTRDDCEIVKKQTLYSGYCAVSKLDFRFRLFEGGWSSVQQRECIVRDPAAAVLLYDPKQDAVVMIEQLRMGAVENTQLESPWMLEIVAGVRDPGETFEETAIRETWEEAGIKITTLLPICQYLPSPGISNEVTQVYCGLVEGEYSVSLQSRLEEGENIKMHRFTTDQALNLLKQGQILSASAIIALQWLDLNRSQLCSVR